MKKRNRILAGALAALFATSLGGCTADSSSASAPQVQTTGGYVEEDASPDKNYNVGLYAVGDTLHAFTVENAAAPLAQQTAHWYTMGPDGQWQERSGSGFEQLAAQVGEGIAYPTAYVTQEGELYWSVTTIDESAERESETSFFAVRDGTAKQIETMPAGEAELTFREGNTALAACGDTLFVMDSSMALTAYDRAGAPAQLSVPELDGSRLLCGTENGYYVLDAENQICHYTPGGTTAEAVLDGSRYGLTDPGMFVQSAAATSNETLYFQMSDGNMRSGNNRLLRYRWDAQLTAPAGGTLTVFSLYRSDTVEAAVNAFQKATGSAVTYTYALEESVEGGWATVSGNRSDALTQLNTQLLAGAGPDVLIVDDMPVDSLIEKGLLADLSGKVSTEGLLANLAGLWQMDEGLYAVPVRCFPTLIGADAETLAAIDNAGTLAKLLSEEENLVEDWQNGNIPLLSYNTTVQLFDTFYPVYAGAIWRGGALNEDACRNFYELLAQIRSGGGRELKNTAPFDQPGGSYYHPQNGTLSGLINRTCRAFCGPVFAMNSLGSDFYYAYGEGAANAGEVKAFASASGATSIQPACAAAVSASSQNSEGAVQFVQTLLSEEVQRQTANDGVPVLKSAILSQWEAGFAEYGTETSTDIVAVLEEMDPSVPSTILRNAAGAGAQKIFDGASLDEAVETARQGAALWLAEQ